MKTVRPKPVGVLVTDEPLTPDEGFVLARIDGRLSVRDLVALTGLDEPRVEEIVTGLASKGAVTLEAVDASSGYLPSPESSGTLPQESGAKSRPRVHAAVAIPPAEGTTSLADFAAALGMDPSAFVAAEGGKAAVEQPVAEERVDQRSDEVGRRPEGHPDQRSDEVGRRPEGHPDPRSGYPPPATSSDAPDPISEVVPTAAAGQLDELEEVHDELEEVPGAPESDADAPANAQADAEESEEALVLQEQDYRKLYEAKFHPLTVDIRVGLAKTAHGSDLLALCLDGDSRVVAAILENPTTGLQHVRLIAFHHRTGVGLEMITRRSDFLKDMLVERRLLRNPQAGDTVLGRIFASKRVFQTYKIAIDRDVPELTRAKGRGFLRQKFQTAPAEERADLILRTEARCLVLMTGCTFDAKTTGILCGRQYNSVLFIQNLAKFSATPPALLAHLMKQPFVRKNMPLKKLLLQHPNMPGDVKRQY